MWLCGGAFLLFMAGAFGCPAWGVYHRCMEGEAELAQAQSNRQIAILEAESKATAAQHLADAEVVRARGIAQANQIIGDSLNGNEAYLHYLWIETLEHNVDKTIVYVPTESNLPVLEAGRFGKPVTKSSVTPTDRGALPASH